MSLGIAFPNGLAGNNIENDHDSISIFTWLQFSFIIIYLKHNESMDPRVQGCLRKQTLAALAECRNPFWAASDPVAVLYDTYFHAVRRRDPVDG